MCGLDASQRHENSTARAIRVVGGLLVAQPTPGLRALRLKLIALPAVYGLDDTRNVPEPWYSLGSVLGDVTNLIAADVRGWGNDRLSW